MTSSAEIQLTDHRRRSSDRSLTHTQPYEQTIPFSCHRSCCYPTVSIPFAGHAVSLVFQVCLMQSVTARWTRRHPMSRSPSAARKATPRVTTTAMPAHCSSTSIRTIANSSKKSHEQSPASSRWKISPSQWSSVWQPSIGTVHCLSIRSAMSYD